MSYKLSTVPHANVYSNITQTMAAANTAYPIIIEGIADITGPYHRTGVVTISIAEPAVVSCVSHGMAIGEVVVFTTTGALPTGITAGTPYYVIAAGFDADNFEISDSLAGAAIDTSGSQSGVHTARCVSKIYVNEYGDYFFNISALLDATAAVTNIVDIWFDVNGTNVANSNTQASIASSNTQHTVSVPIILDLNRGDYVRIFCSSSSTQARWLAVGTQSTPTRPACPSIIMSINKVSQ